MAAETTVLESLDVRLARIEGALPYLATKEDISDLRGELLRELQSESGALRSDFQGQIGALRGALHGAIQAQGSKLSGNVDGLARKMDDETGSGSLRREISEIRGEISEIRGEIGEIRGEITSLRWSIPWSMSLLGVVLGVLIFVLR